MADVHDLPDRDGRADLTARQAKVLQVIRDSVDQRGYPPSLREIGEAVQLASPSSVAYQLRMLERKGYLIRKQSSTDRRRIHILPTEAALEVEKHHRAFHKRMVDAVTTAIPPEQLDVLIKGLRGINDYFYGQEEM